MPLDGVKDSGGKYFQVLYSRCGHPFPEVNDPDYSTMGLVGAVKGEERINWALLRIIDVLMRLSKDKENNSIKLSEEPAVNPSKNGYQLEPAVVWRQP